MNLPWNLGLAIGTASRAVAAWSHGDASLVAVSGGHTFAVLGMSSLPIKKI
jgi:hypothetical protein